MDAILIAQIIDAVLDSDLPRFVGYVVVALMVWRETRALKVEVKNLGETIAESFKEGNARFQKIEDDMRGFEHRLTIIEKPNVTLTLGVPQNGHS